MSNDTLRRYFLDTVYDLEDGRRIHDVRGFIRPKKVVVWNLQTYLIREQFKKELGVNSWATTIGTTH